MRAGLIIFLIINSTVLLSQSYIDSGIKHYKANEFEDALKDFEEAERVKVMFTASAIGKLQFWRGLTRWELNKSNKEITEEVIDNILNDLNQSIASDSSRVNTTNEVFDGIHDLVLNQAMALYKKAGKEKEVWSRIGLLDDYVDKLTLAMKVKQTEDLELNLAKAYHEIGDAYFEEGEDILFLSKAGDYYQEAIKHYEIARYNDPYSKEIIKALIELSKRMDDPDRMEEYQKLLDLAGG